MLGSLVVISEHEMAMQLVHPPPPRSFLQVAIFAPFCNKNYKNNWQWDVQEAVTSFCMSVPLVLLHWIRRPSLRAHMRTHMHAHP